MIELSTKRYAGRRFALTGGGSAGHVVPLIPLIEEIVNLGGEVKYFGSQTGIERSIVEGTGTPYIRVRTAKLRRSLRLSNLMIPFFLILGVLDAFRALKQYSPDILISKGGFVSVPVVIAAWLTRVPIVAHESDISPGLANRIAMPICTIMCTALPLQVLKIRNSIKYRFTGVPIRKEFKLAKEKSEGKGEKPVLLIFGGSLGASAINSAIRSILPKLSEYKIIHICGKGNVVRFDSGLDYDQYEFVTEGMADLMANADIVLCRAGMTSILELLYLKKAAVLVPLGTAASRGDQIENAKLFEKLGIFQTLAEDKIELEVVEKLAGARQNLLKSQQAMKELNLEFGTALLLDVVDGILNHANPKN